MSVFWKVLVFKPKILKKAKIYIEKGILRIDSTGAERFVGHVPHNISLICLESLTRKGLVKKKICSLIRGVCLLECPLIGENTVLFFYGKRES